MLRQVFMSCVPVFGRFEPSEINVGRYLSEKIVKNVTQIVVSSELKGVDLGLAPAYLDFRICKYEVLLPNLFSTYSNRVKNLT